MTAIWLTEGEAASLAVIEEDDFSDIVSLVARIGHDPRTFFRGQKCAGLDFRGSDVDGISFKGADLNEATFYREQFNIVLLTGPMSCENIKIDDRPYFSGNPQHTINYTLSEETKNNLLLMIRRKQRDVDFSTMHWQERLDAFFFYIERCHHVMREINLTGTPVVDIAPLAGLTELTRLNLSSTQVVDITPLKALKQLRRLNLSKRPFRIALATRQSP